MVSTTAVTSLPTISHPNLEPADRPDSLVCSAVVIGRKAYHNIR